MKKDITTVFLILLSTIGFGQTIFDRYANNDDVTLVSISPKMFKMLGQMSINVNDPEAQEFLDMVVSINNFKVLVSSNQMVSKDMLSWVGQQVSRNNLEELMSVKDKEADVVFYVKEGNKEDHVQQLLMYANERSSGNGNDLTFNGKTLEAVLMLLEGDIDLNQISKLTDKMDLPGGKQLKKAQQKNPLQ
jgi:hypothetical protein